MGAIYSCIIVEDDEDFADLLQRYISRLGNLDVLSVHGETTQAALDIEKQKPDLLFLDISISGLEGPEFMELVDHKPQIIIVSGHPPRIMENYKLEICDYLQKPFSMKDLQMSVERCLSKIH